MLQVNVRGCFARLTLLLIDDVSQALSWFVALLFE